MFSSEFYPKQNQLKNELNIFLYGNANITYVKTYQSQINVTTNLD
jgi:hypothetical protein